MSGWIFVLCVLAVYRAAHMISREDGPFDAFIALRTAVHSRLGPNHWASVGIGCLYCVSFWLSAVVVALAVPLRVVSVLYWFAVAGAVVGLDSIGRGGHGTYDPE